MKYPKKLVASFLLNNSGDYEACFDEDFNVLNQTYVLDTDTVAITFEDGQLLVVTREDFEWLEAHENEIMDCSEFVDGFPKSVFRAEDIDFTKLNVIMTLIDGKKSAYYANEDGCAWQADQEHGLLPDSFIADWMADFLDEMAEDVQNIQSIDYMDDNLISCVVEVLNEKIYVNEDDKEVVQKYTALKKLFEEKLAELAPVFEEKAVACASRGYGVFLIDGESFPYLAVEALDTPSDFDKSLSDDPMLETDIEASFLAVKDGFIDGFYIIPENICEKYHLDSNVYDYQLIDDEKNRKYLMSHGMGEKALARYLVNDKNIDAMIKKQEVLLDTKFDLNGLTNKQEKIKGATTKKDDIAKKKEEVK